MRARKHNRTGRSRTSGKFVKLEAYLLRSPAYVALSLAGRAALTELMLVYDGSNNGSIGMGSRLLGVRLGCGHAKAARAIEELVEKGFVETTSIGSFARRNRRASEYRLLMFRCDLSGHTPAKKFMQWVPPPSAALSHPRDNTGSPVRQGASKPTPRYHQKPSTVSPRRPSAPAHCIVGETHIDLPLGCEASEVERGAEIIPLVLTPAAAAKAQTEDYPDMPPFLRRHANAC